MPAEPAQEPERLPGAVEPEGEDGHAEDAQPANTHAQSPEAGSSDAGSSEADSSEADSAEADSAEADSAEADSSGADSAEADSSGADSAEAGSSGADSAGADSAEAKDAHAGGGEPSAGDAARAEAREIGTEALHALAHPLRVRMYDELSSRGPATASELARRFGESTGATSYHLRQLARHGFIEEDPTRGTLRERYWRATPGNQRFASHQTLRSAPPATREAARLVTSEWNRGRVERADHWRATMATWPLEWADASLDLTGHVRLKADELAQLSRELQEVIGRWLDAVRDREDDDLYDVELQIHTFPLDPPRQYEGGLTSEPVEPRHQPPAGPPTPLPPPSRFPPLPPFPQPPHPPEPHPPHPPQPPLPPQPY